MRSTEEKEKMVSDLKKLKETLPEKNFFGEENWKQIDAQIELIESNGDKTAEYFESADDNVYNAVADVESWLEGNMEAEDIVDPADIGEDEEKEESEEDSQG